MAESEGQGGKAAAGEGQKAASAKPGPAIAIIELFGGIRPMAKDLGVAVSTVQGWKERESIPANRHDQIRAAATKKGLSLDTELLRASAQAEAGAGAPPVIEGEAKPAPATTNPSADKTPPASPGAKEQAGAKDEKPSAAGSMASRAGAAASKDGRDKSGKERPAAKAAPPPPPSGRRSGGGLMPGLVLGVVLAVAVAFGAVYSRDSWLPLVSPGSGQQNQAVTEALQGLEDRLVALQSALPPDNSAAMSDLGERLTTLEAAVSQGAGQDPETRAALESLNAQLARLTDRLQALEEQQAAQGAATAGASSEATEALTARLSGESARLDALLTAQSELAARLDQAQQDLASATASREAAPGSEETLMLLAMLQLRDAIRGSAPYDDPLRMLQNLAGEDATLTEIIAPLERRASAGLPSLRDLQGAFPEVARRLAAIELGEEGEGWSAGVLRRLSEAVNLRPVGMVEGDQPTAVAARAEVKLNDGDLPGALAELDGLEGAAAEAAAAWRHDAEARVAADQAVSRLGALVSERFRLTAGG